MRYTEIAEAGRIGSGIHKKEIPADYKGLPILGIGTTSMVLEKDPNTVIMLTKDNIKKDWLVNELEIAKQINWYDTYHPKLKDMPIYVLEMPRLYPIDSKTRKAARALIKTYDDIYHRARHQMYTSYSKNYSRSNKKTILSLFYELFDEYSKTNTDDHVLYQLISFLSNYDVDQYEWDLRMANLMQTADGELVILDPVADREIIDAFSRR